MANKYQCVNIVASSHDPVNISRVMLLKWVNESLSVNIKKVEALCSGVEYCQLMDILFPGCIPLKKVKLHPSVMNEYWSNFKQLQIGFRSVGCEKDVPISRLVEGRFQENFEFLQWFKRFFDANIGDRGKSNYTQPTTTSNSARGCARPVAIVNPVKVKSLLEIDAKSRSQLEKDLKSKIEKYKAKADILTHERDDFYIKLRRIEEVCSADEAPKMKKKELVGTVMNILYDTQEDFQMPEEWI